MTLPNIPPALAALIGRAQETVAKTTALKTAEAVKKKAKPTTSEYMQASNDARRISDELDWVPRALVFLVERWECEHCHSGGDTPHGVFIYKEHRRLANSSCLVRPREAAGLDDSLPRKVKVQHHMVSICPHCAGEEGFTSLITAKIDVPMAHPASPAIYGGALVREWLLKRRYPTGELDVQNP